MTKMFLTTAAAVAALSLGACGRSDDTTTTTNTTMSGDMATSNATTDMGAATPAASAGQTFANTAAASDAFEIESSRLAEKNAGSAAVKAFAAKMIDAHTESTAKLKAAAASASPAITPDPTLTADQQAQLAAMRNATGAAFDRLYIDAQKAAHTATLDTLKSYAASGDVPSLKAFAAELSPKVAAHLNMANGLKA
ncbi:DUF4142 domain-containing protein [Roseomonas aeriglobus]|nr:DUF4142 domain-containing protein [Roseomonas aeriglobus]